MASAGPYASLHLATDNHASTSPLSFFTGRMPFLPPNQQHQSTEGIEALKDHIQLLEIPWILKLLLEILEISWNLVDAPLTSFIISSVIFAHRVISSTLYIGKSSRKQDHCNLRHTDECWSELIIIHHTLIYRHCKLHLYFDIVWLVM